MKKTIRLTEDDLSKLIRRIIKESGEGEVLTCLMAATGMGLPELIKLAPCLQLQQDPTNTTNIQACISAVIPVATAKILGLIDFSDPFGSGKKIMDMTTKCMACAGNVSPVMNENRRRTNRRINVK
jgi:hypothetical protein